MTATVIDFKFVGSSEVRSSAQAGSMVHLLDGTEKVAESVAAGDVIRICGCVGEVSEVGSTTITDDVAAPRVVLSP